MTDEFFYVNDKKGEIISEWLANIEWYVGDKIYKMDTSKLRKVKNTIQNSDLEEAKLSVRIAKANVSYDPENKYYKSVLEREQQILDKLRANNEPQI